MRAVWPEPSPADLLPWLDRRCLRGLPVLVHEVSKRAWGLRLRRTQARTRAIALAHVAFRTFLLRRRPGCKFSQLDSPPRLYPCLRFTEFLAVSAQDSGPSGSLVLSSKNFAFSASCRFSPAHKNRHITISIV